VNGGWEGEDPDLVLGVGGRRGGDGLSNYLLQPITITGLFIQEKKSNRAGMRI